MFYDSNHADITCLPIDGRIPLPSDSRPGARCTAVIHGLVQLMPTAVHACLRRVAGWALACALAVAATGAQAQMPARPAAASGGVAVAASTAALERSVKAAFLYKFLGYAEFPPSAFGDPAAPVVIGVVGADDLAAELARIVNGRSVMGRPVQVKILKETDAPTNVHLLFIGGADPARARAMLRQAKDSPMLVVTEADDGLASGSVINFKIVDERVRFDVSLEAADKNSVKLSSRLLTVANQVHKGAP